MRKRLSTFQKIILGFLGVIILGTVLLMLPFSTKASGGASFGDALFTSTSAVCVTGLVVRDTATNWTIFGQVIILIMIQIGGLGLVSIVALLSVFSGRKVSLMQRTTLQDAISAPKVGGIIKLTLFIFKSVAIVEVAGALAMLPVFCKNFGAKGIWMSFFHSVSAFCNAGFDIMGEVSGEYSSLTMFSGNILITTIICLLIVVGGIGFMTWDDVVTHKFRVKKYKMQSKVILVTTAVLIVVPFLVLFFTDFAGLPMKERICSSIFQAITPRTAGFNTAGLNSMNSGSRAMTMVLMLIGGSPGSTAGGMKTTTVAILIINAVAVFGRRKNVTAFGRRIDDEIVRRAATILVMYVVLAVTGAGAICLIEKIPMGTCFFETASAVGTVGLSLGITPTLGAISKIILIILMFLGRVGALTIIYAAAKNINKDAGQKPVEKITVG